MTTEELQREIDILRQQIADLIHSLTEIARMIDALALPKNYARRL
jgi:prefoldin subunit 5